MKRDELCAKLRKVYGDGKNCGVVKVDDRDAIVKSQLQFEQTRAQIHKLPESGKV